MQNSTIFNLKYLKGVNKESAPKMFFPMKLNNSNKFKTFVEQNMLKIIIPFI